MSESEPTLWAEDWRQKHQQGSMTLSTGKSHRPVSASYAPAALARLRRPSRVEAKHANLALGDDDKHLQPVLLLGALAGRVPVVFAEDEAFLGPRRTEQRELLVRDGHVGFALLVVLLLLSDHRAREVASEADGGDVVVRRRSAVRRAVVVLRGPTSVRRDMNVSQEAIHR